MKALARLRGCAVAPEPSLFAYAHAQSASFLTLDNACLLNYLRRRLEIEVPSYKINNFSNTTISTAAKCTKISNWTLRGWTGVYGDKRGGGGRGKRRRGKEILGAGGYTKLCCILLILLYFYVLQCNNWVSEVSYLQWIRRWFHLS